MKSENNWVNIKGYEDIYAINKNGDIKRLQRNNGTSPGYIKKQWLKNEYPSVGLTVNCITKVFYVHRLLAIAFIPNPLDKKEVNHIDGDKCNNKLSNLEWVTHKENYIHARDVLGIKMMGIKLSPLQVLKIRELREKTKMTHEQIGKLFGVSRINIGMICRRQSWVELK